MNIDTIDRNVTREEMWRRLHLQKENLDYQVWAEKKELLEQLAAFSGSCIFAVDVYKGKYVFASENFNSLFGYQLARVRNVEEAGNLLEERIHPDDRMEMEKKQIEHSYFIYSLPPEKRNDFQTIYRFRLLNAEEKYINVISRQQVLLQDSKGKAWIIMGILNIAPEQQPFHRISHSFFNRKTGEIYLSSPGGREKLLTKRQHEILSLIRQGFLSKEIAEKLNISIHTVNNHRKNMLDRLGVDNSMEAIYYINPIM